MRFIKILAFMFLYCRLVFSQEITTTKINVKNDYIPSIIEAVRLNENAIYNDTSDIDKTQVYNFLDKTLKSNFKLKKISPAVIKNDKLKPLDKLTFSLLFGSAWTTQADIIYNSIRSKKTSYSLVLNHYANSYDEYKNSRNLINLSFKNITKQNIFRYNLNYDRRASVFLVSKSDDSDLFKNRFAFTELFFKLINNRKNNNLNYNTSLKLYDFNELSENFIGIKSELDFLVNDIPINVLFSSDIFFNYNNKNSIIGSQKSYSSSIFPSVQFSRYGYKFIGGLNINYINNNSLSLLPEITFSKELVKDIILIKAGSNFNVYRNSLKALSDKNPYMHSFGTNQLIFSENLFTQETLYTEEKNYFIYLKNVLDEYEFFETSLSYSSIQNFDHFIQLDTFNYTRFSVDYLSVKQVHLKIKYNKVINDISSLNINLDYYNWNQQVYNHPNFVFYTSLPINFRNKLTLSPTFLFKSKMVAARYIDQINLNNNVESIELASRMHLNLGLTYMYSDKLSAKLSLNNITNSKNEDWIGISPLGFNVSFCIKSSF